MTKKLYVGYNEFASYKEAELFCKEKGLSLTLISDHPYHWKKWGL